MKQILKGDELMLFKNKKSIAYATSHVLTITGNTVDIASKDHGFWGASEVGSLTWEITSENLYTQDAYDTLFDAMVKCEPIDVAFGKVSNYNKNGIDNSTADWAPDTATEGSVKYGKAVITSLVANANTGENATFSITLTGQGAISKTAPSPGRSAGNTNK